MSTMWDPDQYLKFAGARLQPAVDLLARIDLSAPRQIYDLGCGTGSVTRLLRARWPQAALTGIDSSPTMLAQAAREWPDIGWVQCDLASWRASSAPDLIFSNAALHWLPEHDTLLPQLMAQLAPAGVLAIQMPRNFLEPSHLLIADSVNAGPWASRLRPLLRPVPVQAPAYYYRLLEAHAVSMTLWETEYLQVLHGSDPVKEWVKGTWLKPLLDALEPHERDAFEAEYARRLRLAYPPLNSGVTLFPFKRLFLVAARA